MLTPSTPGIPAAPRLPRLPAAYSFTLTDSDKAFLADIESIIHTIKNHIKTFTEQYDPALRPPSRNFAWSDNYFPFPREFNHCARTLHLLHSLWNCIKSLLNAPPDHAHAPAPGHPAAPPSANDIIANAQHRCSQLEARIIADVAKRYNLVIAPDPA